MFDPHARISSIGRPVPCSSWNKTAPLSIRVGFGGIFTIVIIIIRNPQNSMSSIGDYYKAPILAQGSGNT